MNETDRQATSIPTQNLYRILNVEQSADTEAIRKAIINASRLWSNRTNAPQIEKRQEAERMVKLIDEAEAVLLDPAKRSAFDRQLSSGAGNGVDVDESDLAGNEDLVKESWRLLSDGEVADAMFVAEKATQKEPSNPFAWAVLAESKARWGENDDAIYEYKKAIKLKPNEASFYFDLGCIYEATDELGDAVQQYERAAKIDPQTPMYRAAIGAILVKAGRTADAIPILEQCRSEDAENTAFQRLLAVAYVDHIVEGWTHVDADHPGRLAEGAYATNKAQVLNAQALIRKAESLKFNDEELRAEIRLRRADIERQLQRQYNGSTLAAILGSIIWFFVFGLGLILGPLYFFAARPPRYAVNKRLLLGEETSGEAYKRESFGARLVANAITGAFLPIMILVNLIRNYTGENALPKRV
jgi:tetratricopeptide (TPR) repeat protein